MPSSTVSGSIVWLVAREATEARARRVVLNSMVVAFPVVLEEVERVVVRGQRNDA